MILVRVPDWAIYGVVVAAIVTASLARREHADAPEAPPPFRGPEGSIVGAASVFDPAVVIKAQPSAGRRLAGTAFSVSASGVWLTARHVVDGCRQIAIMVEPDRGVIASAHLDASRDVAVLTTAGGGAPGLRLALDAPLHVGDRGFHPGFPQGRAGEATSRLLGRETLVLHASRRLRGAHAEPVLAWAEAGRTDWLDGDLDGLSGAPVLDAQGRVVGLTLAQAPRRGRIYTTPPEVLREVLRRQHVKPDGPAGAAAPVTVDSYGRVADTLRRELQVAQVRCLKA